ncbi:MAG: DUF2330 domain-containing protein [Polyangiaceae bacterium]
MRRTTLALAMAMTAGTMALGYGRDARACGGCFHPPTENVSDITDERMMLAVSPQQSTLYDQIRYSGNPASFAWVLPIHGTVDVGLSADVMFDSIDSITATQIQSPVPACPAPPSDCQGSASSDAGFAPANAGAGGGDSVVVTKQENVGPFETVQLHATDSSALNQWLSDNGFVIPPEVTPIIDAYVTEGFDFLAMKLLPNEGVQAMRPVRVTFPGASVTLPLRMAAIGTGATVGITIWTVSDGRYEPQNFPFFHIEDKDLIWDFKTQSSNYTTLRAQNEALYPGNGWEIESSIDVNESTIQSVVESGGVYYGGGGGFGGGAPVSNADDDYLPVGDADGGADGGAYESADQVRSDDLAALFAGMSGPNVRITRMRSDISHTAMTNDFTLQASSDQSELSNVRSVTQQINTQCPIYDHCEVVGYGTPDESAASMQGNSSGCVTAARSETDGGLTALLGVLGMVLVRRVGSRRKRR